MVNSWWWSCMCCSCVARISRTGSLSRHMVRGCSCIPKSQCLGGSSTAQTTSQSPTWQWPQSVEGDRPVRRLSGCADLSLESDCLGVQSKVRGKLLVRLNITPRPIANKYSDGKLKRTLRSSLYRRVFLTLCVRGCSCIPKSRRHAPRLRRTRSAHLPYRHAG